MKILNCYEIPKYDVGDTLRYEERKSEIGDIKKGDIFTVLSWNDYSHRKRTNSEPLYIQYFEATSSVRKHEQVEIDEVRNNRWGYVLVRKVHANEVTKK